MTKTKVAPFYLGHGVLNCIQAHICIHITTVYCFSNVLAIAHFESYSCYSLSNINSVCWKYR